MEILIPGLILVALMVYASTRIKRSAARAYERESLTFGTVSVTKPDGFISVVDPADGKLFEALSKDFGVDDLGDVRRAAATIKRHPGKDAETLVNEIRSSFVEVLSESEVDGDLIVIARERERTAALDVHYKIAESNSDVYVLRIAVIPNHEDELASAVSELIESFKVERTHLSRPSVHPTNL